MRSRKLHTADSLMAMAPRLRRFALVLTQGNLDRAEQLLVAGFDTIWQSTNPLTQSSCPEAQAFSAMVSVRRRDPKLIHNAHFQSSASARDALFALPWEERAILALILIERFSIEETASLMALSEPHTLNLYHRARRTLDQALTQARAANGAA